MYTAQELRQKIADEEHKVGAELAAAWHKFVDLLEGKGDAPAEDAAPAEGAAPAAEGGKSVDPEPKHEAE